VQIRLTHLSAQILEHEFKSGFLEFAFGALDDEHAVHSAMTRDENQIRVVIHSAAQVSTRSTVLSLRAILTAPLCRAVIGASGTGFTAQITWAPST
jgi:nucleoside-diphosphate-sugar epimerase